MVLSYVVLRLKPPVIQIVRIELKNLPTFKLPFYLAIKEMNHALTETTQRRRHTPGTKAMRSEKVKDAWSSR